MTVYVACGGCGARIPEDRCFGCFHDFGGDSPKVVPPNPPAPDFPKQIAELEAKLETANHLVTCYCGVPVDAHDMGDGHSPVDMYHYDQMKRTEEIERLKNLLCLADEALMLSHGCFPLDRTGRKQRYLNDAAKAIRAVTGDDFHERKRLAAQALQDARELPVVKS